jgi:hypothetical protein
LKRWNYIDLWIDILMVIYHIIDYMIFSLIKNFNSCRQDSIVFKKFFNKILFFSFIKIIIFKLNTLIFSKEYILIKIKPRLKFELIFNWFLTDFQFMKIFTNIPEITTFLAEQKIMNSHLFIKIIVKITLLVSYEQIKYSNIGLNYFSRVLNILINEIFYLLN